jgi:hypothetical protein
MQGITEPTSFSIEERPRFQWVLTEFLSSMEFLMQQHNNGNIDEHIWLRWSKTLDYWLTFPGIRATWVGRATQYTDVFTNYIDNRLTNGDFSFNVENNRRYMLTGKLS